MFGSAFFREHGDQPPRLWCQAIARLSESEIAKGLANLGDDGLRFPPNLSQFIEACRRPKPVRHLGVIEDHSDVSKKENEDKAWAYMEWLAGRKLR